MKTMSLSPAFCLHNGVVILDQDSATVSFGMVNTEDTALCRRLEQSFYRCLSEDGRSDSGTCVHFVKISKEVCARNVSKLFAAHSYADEKHLRVSAREVSGGSASGRDIVPDGGFSAEKGNFVRARDTDESPAVALLDSILNDALISGCTDIHIENMPEQRSDSAGTDRHRDAAASDNTAQAVVQNNRSGHGGHVRGVLVRMRICGKLKEHIVFNEETAAGLVLRIKNLAALNTLEKRRPQDGQFTFVRHRIAVSVRVSCIPVINGESVVLRLLDPSRISLEPEKLGFTADQLSGIYSLLTHSNGLILVCGPTGSGKSTTLASLLALLQKQCGNTKKIVTIEDPVEYVLSGVTQVQINNAVSQDFDEMLRRIFRQDPDIIMLGEIRDKKTASVALSAALTGHLVFATLHTSGKEEAVLRLKDLDADEKLVRAVLLGVISQKLVEHDGDLKLEGDVAIVRAG